MNKNKNIKASDRKTTASNSGSKTETTKGVVTDSIPSGNRKVGQPNNRGSKPKKYSKPFDKNSTIGQSDGHNDIEGYTRFRDIIDPATQLAFSTPFGGVYRGLRSSVPGILTIPYIYCTGIDNPSTPSDTLGVDKAAGYHNWAITAFNVAGRSVYTTVRASRGGSRPYIAADMEHMLLSAMSIFATFASLMRALKLAKKYSYANKYLGDALLKALGFDREDLVYHYQNYASALNLIIKRADIIKLPKGLAALDRGNGLNSNVFKDNNTDNLKQQYIAYRPYAIYEYDEINGSAVPVKLEYAYGFDTVMNQLDHAITQLGNSESFQIMIGDLANVYKDDIMTIEAFNPDDDLEFVGSAEVVVQLQNAKTIYTTYDDGDRTIYGSDIDSNWDAGVPYLTLNQDKRTTPGELALNEGSLFYGPAPADTDTYIPFGIRLPIYSAGYPDEILALVASGHYHNTLEDVKTFNLFDDNPTSEAIIYSTRNSLNSYFAVHKFQNNNKPKLTKKELEASTEKVKAMPESVKSLITAKALASANDYEQGYRIGADHPYVSGDTAWLIINGVGTEILLRYEIYNFEVRNGEGIGSKEYAFGDLISPTHTLTKTQMELIMLLSTFQVAPKIVLYTAGDTSSMDVQVKMLGDIVVPCDMDIHAWMRINAACIYSMGLIPQYSDASGTTTLVRK